MYMGLYSDIFVYKHAGRFGEGEGGEFLNFDILGFSEKKNIFLDMIISVDRH